jgi:flagellar motor switch protein FliG
MSMLNRFRKKGGFQQLVTLIETSDPEKQKNLLHLVGTEDPGWAHLLKIKCLTPDRILAWPDEVLKDIVPSLSDRIALVLYLSVSKTQKNKFQQAASLAQKRYFLETSHNENPTPSEITSANLKLVHAVRELEKDGKIKFQTFDPILVIDPSIAA